MAEEKIKFVEIPIMNIEVGIIPTLVEQLGKRKVRMDLTRNLHGKNMEAVFGIKIEKGKAIAYPVELKLLPFYIRKMLRKSISYVEDSLIVKSADKTLKIKPFLITRKRVSRAVRASLRQQLKTEIENFCKNLEAEDILIEVMNGKIQKTISQKLKKTYPLSLCEIRRISIEK
ncbi:hypothetical protein COV15_03280 [Candidatus Woesearchaeota archaeon CG10_big_fil_rev_8_21_14_0_10_34_12]|nr:MAG: hypothetical protein COV15_03280 [Candidatus Woesearchaeota archaeon CG10_big_fil_rev_8_21_14_0_10_34_12]